MGLNALRWLGVVVMMAATAGLSAAPPKASTEPSQVLYLNSYDQRMNWAKEIFRGMEEVLQPESSNLVLHVFNLDSKRYYSREYFQSVRDLFQVKYRDTRFSLVLCSDNNAFDFVRENRKRFFRDVPIVFCGYNDFHDSDLAELPRVTGVAEVFSVQETLQLIHRLHPKVREVFIINDYLETGRKSVREIEASLAPFQGVFRFSWSEDLPIDALKARIAALTPDTAVLLGVYYADRDGKAFTFERSAEQIAGSSSVPVYCLHAFYLGHGPIGGKVIGGYSQGRAMGLRAKRVLAGEDPATMPVGKADVNQYAFDFPQLSRFGIPEKDLPAGSLVLNRPVTLYETYRREIWAAGLLMLILVGSVIALVSTLALRRRAEQELRLSEERFRELAEASWEGILLHEHGLVRQVNRMFLEMFGWKASEIEGKDMATLILSPKSREEAHCRAATGNLDPYEVVAVRKDGSEFPAEFRIRRMEVQGREIRMVAIRDLSEQRALEERLNQAQKMEAIGTLAGGIAHDFNNILSAIFGYTELLLMDAPEGSETRTSLEHLMQAAGRARDLARQILTFSRHTKRVEEPIKVASIVKEALKLLRATLPASIEIRSDLEAGSMVLGDPTQIHQVLMNLCTNAALAMKDHGGVLEVTLSEVTLDEESSAAYQGLRPGQWLQLCVSDSGCGMDPEVLRRIFEPFFTTRPQGQGTGLGLSVVHGIVQGLGGKVMVYSEPGEGSTFKVYLPVLEASVEQRPEKLTTLPGGQERILFVDDEAFQVDLATRMLGRLGYRVTVCTSSEDALAWFEADPGRFDLLITDMTMPRMTGDTLIERIRALSPEFPVILATGFSERLTKERLANLRVQGFVMKPFALGEIAVKIRTALAKELV